MAKSLSQTTEDLRHLALILPLNAHEEETMKEAVRLRDALVEYRSARAAFDVAVEEQPQPENYHAIGKRFERADKSILGEA